MDAVDETLAREDLIIEKRIQSIRSNKRRELEPRGHCLYCHEKFDKGDKRLFCDDDCRADHIKYK